MPAIVAAGVTAPVVGGASIALDRPDALAWKCVAFAVLCAVGTFTLPGQTSPRWFIPLLGLTLGAYAAYSALRASAYFLDLAETTAWSNTFGRATADIIGALTFVVVSACVFALHYRSLPHPTDARPQELNVAD